MSPTIILCHLVHSPSHPHSLTLPDDEDHNMPKSEYHATYHAHNASPSPLHPSFAATSQTLQFGLEKIQIIQNFPNLLALLSNLDDFFQKILHRMKANSTKLSPFPLQFGVILKPPSGGDCAHSRSSAPGTASISICGGKKW